MARLGGAAEWGRVDGARGGWRAALQGGPMNTPAPGASEHPRSFLPRLPARQSSALTNQVLLLQHAPLLLHQLHQLVLAAQRHQQLEAHARPLNGEPALQQRQRLRHEGKEGRRARAGSAGPAELHSPHGMWFFLAMAAELKRPQPSMPQPARCRPSPLPSRLSPPAPVPWRGAWGRPKSGHPSARAPAWKWCLQGRATQQGQH